MINSATRPTIEIASEDSFIIRLGVTVSSETPMRLRQLKNRVEHAFGANLIETIAAYTTLLIKYDINQLNASDSLALLSTCLTDTHDNDIQNTTTLHTIPVCYHPDLGMDLITLAKAKKLNIEDVTRIHSDITYHVYATGFSPAFAYLGFVDARIATPRHKIPRTHIPAGSLGIAHNQTAIYPVASPAGWQIIGQTPLDFSLKNPKNLTLFNVGDQVKFAPISHDAFMTLKGKSLQEYRQNHAI